MTLDNINTKDFLFNPKDKDFVDKMIDRNPIFDLPKDKEKWLCYICLVYDVKSELRRNNRDYLNRKLEGAKISGFELKNGRFDKDIEEMLLGENDDLNKAIVQFVYYQYNNDYKLLFVLEEQYNKAIKQHASTISEWDEKERKLLTVMKEQIEEIENKLFGGTEVINMQKILYLGIDNATNKVPRKEEELKQYERDGLESYSPFPGYKPEKIRFLGDDVNNVTQKT